MYKTLTTHFLLAPPLCRHTGKVGPGTRDFRDVGPGTRDPLTWDPTPGTLHLGPYTRDPTPGTLGPGTLKSGTLLFDDFGQVQTLKHQNRSLCQ